MNNKIGNAGYKKKSFSYRYKLSAEEPGKKFLNKASVSKTPRATLLLVPDKDLGLYLRKTLFCHVRFSAYIHLKDLIDICVVGLLIWGAIAWARRVHAILALVGLLFIWLFYLAAMQLELQLTAWFFQGFFAALVIFLVVVFQDDLRRLFERIAVGLRRQNAPLDARRTAVLVAPYKNWPSGVGSTRRPARTRSH